METNNFGYLEKRRYLESSTGLVNGGAGRGWWRPLSLTAGTGRRRSHPQTSGLQRPAGGGRAAHADREGLAHLGAQRRVLHAEHTDLHAVEAETIGHVPLPGLLMGRLAAVAGHQEGGEKEGGGQLKAAHVAVLRLWWREDREQRGCSRVLYPPTGAGRPEEDKYKTPFLV